MTAHLTHEVGEQIQGSYHLDPSSSSILFLFLAGEKEDADQKDYRRKKEGKQGKTLTIDTRRHDSLGKWF
jgi:hypothetical protein